MAADFRTAVQCADPHSMAAVSVLTLTIWLPFQYYAECHAVIYVVDSADRERMDESKEVFGEWEPLIARNRPGMMHISHSGVLTD